MTETQVRYTYKDYLLLPENERYQIFEGCLLREPAPTPYHQGISGTLGFALRQFVRDRNLGLILDAPIDVVLSDENVLQPDILFIARERRGIVKHNRIHGPPDLVIEVLSPGTKRRDRAIKTKIYAAYGVRECWLVDPQKKTVDVLVQAGGAFRRHATYRPGDRAASLLLPGFEIGVDDLFAPL